MKEPRTSEEKKDRLLTFTVTIKGRDGRKKELVFEEPNRSRAASALIAAVMDEITRLESVKGNPEDRYVEDLSMGIKFGKGPK